MSNRVKTWRILLCLGVISGGSFPLGASAPPPVEAGSEEAAAQALDILNSGDLQGAEQAYRVLLQQYPTAGIAPEATFRLGYIQYMRQEYPDALSTLNLIAAPPATQQVKAAGDALIPQVTAAEAAAMQPNDPQRNKTFQDAIQQFEAFIRRYPRNQEIQSANYGRALASYEIQDYDGAEKSLAENLRLFPGSDQLLDSEDLLAVVLTADAEGILTAHGDKDAALAKFDQALRYLAGVIQRRADVVIENDAQFQIGEVLFERGNSEEGTKRTTDLNHAIEAFRAVQPQDVIVQAEQVRMAATLAVVRQVASSGNRAALEEAQRRQDRENSKLALAKAAPDQTFNARVRIAACYFLLEKYDESRVMLRYLQPLAEQADQKQQIKYYITLTYASQGLMEKAEDSYNDFQSYFKGVPLGENLPLAMGAGFLNGSNPQPDKAISYLQQEREIYPNSPLVNDALNQQAGALVRQKKFDEAISTYKQFLATNPPGDQAAAAEQGIGAIYQQTGDMDGAVKQYQKVVDTYPSAPMAEECAFYVTALQASQDENQAMSLLQGFVTKYPDGKFTPKAMLMIGQIQARQGDKDAAAQTYKDIIAKFPKSDSVSQAYFQQADILARAGNIDGMVALLREFIKDCPNSKDLFYAYDTIANNQVSGGKIDDAVATYNEMASQHADDPKAATALVRIAELLRRNALSQGRYASMDDKHRSDWSDGISESIAAAERVLERFPDSDQLGTALNLLLADQHTLLDAELKSPQEIESYLDRLASKSASNPKAQSRILFTLATFTYENNPYQGLTAMSSAYNPVLMYAPADLDLFGAALISQHREDEGYKVYEKLANDYPLPPSIKPAEASPAIQDAQATALYGMASALEKQGQPADAEKLFDQLKAEYPWSPKVVEANFSMAKSLVSQGKPDDASKLLVNIVGNHNATASVRARAFLLIGDIEASKGNTDAAIDSYLKTAVFYAGVPDAASEGLWRGAQMLERQAAELSEDSTPKRSVQMGKAVNAYRSIVTKYPASSYAPQAEDRLKALGA